MARVASLCPGAVSLIQFTSSFSRFGEVWGLAVANLFAFFLMFSFLLEFCRLRFRHRALGFVALALFVLCVLPLILAGLFSNETLANLSFLAPGIVVLIKPGSQDSGHLVGLTLAQFGICVLLFLAWLQQWKVLLASPAAASSEH